MTKHNLLLPIVCLIMLTVSIYIQYKAYKFERYDNILCQSIFTENSVEKPNLFFTGSITMKLFSVKKGEIDISGNILNRDDVEDMSYVYRTIYFDFKRESPNILFLSNVSVSTHVADTFTGLYFAENIIDIVDGKPKSIRIVKFKNSYILGSIGMPHAACVSFTS